MKIWSVDFTGLWPVGTAAIVCTNDLAPPEQAIEMFRKKWAKRYPGSDPEPVTVTQLSCGPGAVHILADGNY